MERIFTIEFGDYDYFSADVIHDVETIVLHLFPNDKLDDAKTKERIKEAIKFNIEFNDSYEQNENSKISNELCNRLLIQEDILEGVEYIYLDADLEDARIFIENNPKLKDYKITLYVNDIYNHNTAREIKEKLPYNNIYIKLPSVSSGLYGTKPIKLERYMLNSFLFNKMCFDIEKMNLSPLESLIYAYQMINIKELETNKKIDNGDELVNKSLSLHSINELFNSCLSKLGFRYKYVSGKLNNHYIDTLFFAVYINDKKYNVDGIYYFSPILEKLYNGGKVCNSFKYFAKNISSLTEEKNSFNLEVTRGIDKNTLTKFIETYKSAEEIKGVDEELYLNMNTISKLIDGKRLLNPFCNIKNASLPGFLNEDKVEPKEVVSTAQSFIDKIDNEIDDTKFICLLDSVLDACDRMSGTTTNLLTLVDMVDASDRQFDYDIRFKRTIDFEKRITRAVNEFFGIDDEYDEDDDEI